MFTVFERNDSKAMQALALNSIDAITLPIAHRRDINGLSAAAVGGAHPQAHLLSSVARSHDGMIALSKRTKACIEQDNPPLGFTVEAVDASTTAMRRHIAGGRAATPAMGQEPATARISTAEGGALIDQLGRLIDTYPPSFDREEKIAASMDRISHHLATPDRCYDLDDPVVQMLFDEVIVLDDERAADQQARQLAVASR